MKDKVKRAGEGNLCAWWKEGGGMEKNPTF